MGCCGRCGRLIVDGWCPCFPLPDDAQDAQVAVERDGKVDIINLEPTPAKMVEVLNTYKAGK